MINTKAHTLIRQRLDILPYVLEDMYIDFLLMVPDYWHCKSLATSDPKTSIITLT